MVPPTSPAKQISGGQVEERHGVVHQLQQEYHQSYLQHYLSLFLLKLTDHTPANGETDEDDELWTMMIMGQMRQYKMSVMKLTK